MLVDLPENGDLFSDLQKGFRSSQTIAYLLTVVSDGLLINLGLLEL